jgi:hypothetical protein
VARTCPERSRMGPSPAKPKSKSKLRVNPQPPIILRPSNQPSLHRILPNVLAFIFQTFVRSQHMIEGLLFPDRTGRVQKLVNAMSRGTLQALQDVHQREGPAVFIPQRREKQVNMIGHNHSCVQMDSRLQAFRGRGPHSASLRAGPRHTSRTTLPQTVFKNKIAGRFRKDSPTARTESNEHRRISLLQMWKPPSISILTQWRCFGGHGRV